MDFGALTPEINSARIYAGPGSAPMLAAASAWDVLAAELGSAASAYSSVVTSLAEGSWLGPASASMAAAATPYVDWMSTTATQAEETGYQARSAAAAFEAAFAMTVPPAEIAANRTQLAALVATNVLGQNTPAIAANEALYGEMWAQDAAAMYGYAGSSAAAATVIPFSTPPETTNAAGAASQGSTVAQAAGTSSSAGVQSTLSQVVSSLPNTLQSMAAPTAGVNPFAPGSNTATTGIAGFLNLLSGQTGSAFGSFITSGFSNGILSGNWLNPASISPAVTTAFGDIGFLAVAGQAGAGLNPALLTGAAAPSAMSAVSHVGSAVGSLASAPNLGGSAVSAGMGRATLVGAMSVPNSWAAATPGTGSPIGAASAGLAYAPSAGVQEAGMAGAPGMPGMPMAGSGGRSFGFAAPRYGFRPTVVAHPPAAG
jgi:PPE-repeat protein